MTNFGKFLVFVLCLGVAVLIFFLLPGKTKVIVDAPDNENSQTSLDSKGLILGNVDDLVSFSVLPNAKVHNNIAYQGSVKGGYFFEANILINILDSEKNVLRQSNALATSEWMTAEPVLFSGSLDITGLPLGAAYLEIHNDNASGLPEHDKSILIPIIIE